MESISILDCIELLAKDSNFLFEASQTRHGEFNIRAKRIDVGQEFSIINYGYGSDEGLLEVLALGQGHEPVGWATPKSVMAYMRWEGWNKEE